MKRIFNNKPIVLAQITPKVLFELDKDKVYTLIIEERKNKKNTRPKFILLVAVVSTRFRP